MEWNKLHIPFHLESAFWWNILMYYSLHRLLKNHCLVTPFKTLSSRPQYHEDVIKWKTFPRYWPFVQRINRSPVNFPHKGQWRRALKFSLISAWIIGCANTNTREARDLRRHVAYYDVILIFMSVNWVIICKVKACDQFGIIVLPKPLATEYQLDTGNHNSVKEESKYNDYMYLLWICIWKCRLQVLGHLFNVLSLPMPGENYTVPKFYLFLGLSAPNSVYIRDPNFSSLTSADSFLNSKLDIFSCKILPGFQLFQIYIRWPLYTIPDGR